jgi:hypothetical protein
VAVPAAVLVWLLALGILLALAGVSFGWVLAVPTAYLLVLASRYARLRRPGPWVLFGLTLTMLCFFTLCVVLLASGPH